MKSGKAPESDGFMVELFKADISVATIQLHPIIALVWEEEIIPDKWKERIIIKLPKKETSVFAIIIEVLFCKIPSTNSSHKS